jgi:hypothetical protein
MTWGNELTRLRILMLLFVVVASLRKLMNSPDQNTLLRAIEDARRILEEYIGAGPRDPAQTLHRLLAVLDKGELVHALDRISSRRVMRLLENTKKPRPTRAPSGRGLGERAQG